LRKHILNQRRHRGIEEKNCWEKKSTKKELEKTKGKSPFENVNGNSTQEENGNGHSAPITMKCPVTSVHTSSNSDAIAEKEETRNDSQILRLKFT